MKEAIHVMGDHWVVPVSDLCHASAFQVMNMQYMISWGM